MLGTLRVDVAHFPQVVLFVETRSEFFELQFLLQLLQLFFELLDFLGLVLLVALKVGALRKVELRKQVGHALAPQTFVNFVVKIEKLF